MGLGEIAQETLSPTVRKFKPPLSPVRGVPQAISPVATKGVTVQGAVQHNVKQLAPIPMKPVAKIAEAMAMLEKRAEIQLGQVLNGTSLQADDGVDPAMLSAASKALAGGTAVAAYKTFKGRNSDSTYKARKAAQQYLASNPQLNSSNLGAMNVNSSNVLARSYVNYTPEGSKIEMKSPKSTALALRETDTATRMGLREDSAVGKLRNRIHPAKPFLGRAGFTAGLAAATQIDGTDPASMAARIALPAAGGILGSVPEMATKLRSSSNAAKAMETMPHLKPSEVVKGKKMLATSLATGALGMGGWGVAGLLAGHVLNNSSVGL